MTLPVKYAMQNVVNGKRVEITGGGTWSAAGVLSLNLGLSAYPADWNAMIIPCICSGPGPGPDPIIPGPRKRKAASSTKGLIGFAPNGYETEPGTFRRATLWEEDGTIIAEVSATGVYKKTTSGLDFDIDVRTKTKKGSLISELTGIQHYSFSIHPKGAGRVRVLSHYALIASNARRAFGCTSIDYQLIRSQYTLDKTIVGFNRIKLQHTAGFVQYIAEQFVCPESGLGIK